MQKFKVTWMQYDFEQHQDTAREQLFDDFWSAEDFMWNDPGEKHEFGHTLPSRYNEKLLEFDRESESWIELMT